MMSLKSRSPPVSSQDAVLSVHGDHVYIFRANFQSQETDEISRSLQTLLDSVKWQ